MINLWSPRNSEFADASIEKSILACKLDEIGTLDMPSAIKRLLYSRGYTDNSKIANLTNSSPQHLSDPFSICDMLLGTERLVRAWQQQETVCIYGDFDMDGTSGLAMLMDGLTQLGFKKLVPRQPKRMSDGYGFHPHLVEELAKLGVTLILTVDVGITGAPAVEKSRELGIDVIITDHHQVVDQIPKAYAVINPNREDDHSGLGYLCGTGVAFYVLRALKRLMVNKELIKDDCLHLQSLLDCFVIATLTDMVPLIGDNRVLVRLGLKQLELTQRHGLNALLENLGMDGRPLSSQDVAIRFAPKLNALSRMEGKLMPIDIYLAKTEELAKEMIDQVLKSNANRVQFQEDGDNEASALLADWKYPDFIFVTSEKFHRGVVGLIATRLANHRRLPTFIGAKDANGVVTGSARLPNGSNGSLVEALESAQGFLTRFGGHEAAAGFEFEIAHHQQILDCLNQHYKKLNIAPEVHESHFDIDLELFEVDSHLMNWMDRIGPFGTGFETPLFRMKNITLEDIFKLRGGHLRLKLKDNMNKKIDGVLFSPAPELLAALPSKGSEVTIVAEVQWNYFGGSKGIQVLVKDIFSTHKQTDKNHG